MPEATSLHRTASWTAYATKRRLADARLSSRLAGDTRSDSAEGDLSAGVVTSILTSSFVDGPGNRAVVFLQGCNLRCLYCHNPYTRRLCAGCGDCVDVCPQGALCRIDGGIRWDRASCQGCDRCVHACQHDSTPRTEILTPEQVWDRIEPLSPFLSGVTASGGEPTLQYRFLRSLFSLLHRSSNLTAFIETNGSVPRVWLEVLEPELDGALVDLKVMDPALHSQLTGCGNAMCLDAIRFLSGRGKLAGVQVVVLPGYSDGTENAERTAGFLSGIDPGIPLRFLRFRPHGASGQAQSWPQPDDACLNHLVAVASAAGMKDVTRSL